MNALRASLEGNWLSMLLNTNMNFGLVFEELAEVCFNLWIFRKWFYCRLMWRCWLRHCATSRKVADSIPIGFIGFFHWLSLWEKWVPEILRGEWWRALRRADNLATFMCRLSRNLGASTSWYPMGLWYACTGISLPSSNSVDQNLSQFKIWVSSNSELVQNLS